MGGCGGGGREACGAVGVKRVKVSEGLEDMIGGGVVAVVVA